MKTGSIKGTVSINGMSDAGNTVIVVERQISGETATVLQKTSMDPKILKAVSGDVVFSTVSNSDGTYVFDSLPEGIYTLTAAKEHTLGAVINNIQVEGTASKFIKAVTVVDIVLTATGSISGTVQLNGALTGLSGTFIYAEGTSYVAGTDDSGNFIVSDIPIGTYNIVFYHNGYASVTQAAVVVAAAADTPVGIIDLQVACDITTFSFEAANNPGLPADAIGTISGTDIDITVPYGVDVTGLKATFGTTGLFTIVNGAVQISGNTPNDFTSPVTYTVIGADSITKDYTITVTIAMNSAKDITSFSFESVNNPLLSADVTGTISGTDITLTVPYNFDLVADDLIATFSITGASIEIGGVPQTNGVTSNNFNSAVVYRVTAADSTTKDYTVTVINELSPEKDITEFRFEAANNPVLSTDVIGNIDGTDILLVVLPNGTDVTALVATFLTTGSSVEVGGTVQVSGTTPNDFSGPVAYRVTAVDGTTKDYIVTAVTSGWVAMKVPGKGNPSYWYSITSSSDGTRLAAVVYNGYIYTSTDSGATWTEQTAAGSRRWTSITSSADGTRLSAVAEGERKIYMYFE